MKTYKQQVKGLKGRIVNLEKEIEQLKSMLAEKEINPLDYQQLGELCMKYYQALITIKVTHNAATKAWEIADSALRE